MPVPRDILATGWRRTEHGGIEVLTPLWPRWTEVAFEHAAEARAALHRGLGKPDRRDRAGDIGAELKASMIAVSASAHALDALFGNVKAHLEAAGVAVPSPKKRPMEVLETLKLGFGFSGDPRERAREFKWLFDLPDSAVHYREDLAAPAEHESGLYVGPGAAGFNNETANRAGLLLADVLAVCASRPKPATTDWAKRYHVVIEALLAGRPA